MITQSEAQLETALVEQLSGAGWEAVKLVDENALWNNLRKQVEVQNEDVLGSSGLSDAEWKNVHEHLKKGDVFEKAHKLRERYCVQRDDGSTIHIRFFNSEEWCRNRYQIASQISVRGKRKNRYDVTLLVNGFPLCQVELKKTGVELKVAFDQINRYQQDSFKHAGGLFQYVQIFVISNGVNTRYYANNRDQSYKQTFTWADVDNLAMNRLGEFASIFLEKCHLSKMIARYVVMHESDKVLMVLRPYQYYAAEAVTHAVLHRTGNGYVWHTTGSGKTLTSFKAAQNLVAIQKVDKVIFVVDRADLDYQTTREFNHFEKSSVDETTNTRSLVRQLADPNRRLAITTIQKLNTALSSDRYQAELSHITGGRVVFIFDECHRSQFGETHRRIRKAFPQAQLFGFTGTPIFEDNAIGGRTTGDLFGKTLHRYVITDAIRDGNVLRFSVEYNDVVSVDVSQETPDEAKRILEHPNRIRAIAEWVAEHHKDKTHKGRYSAIMTVSSVDALLLYYQAFSDLKDEGVHDLNITTIFTYAANEDDAGADGLLPDTKFPDGEPPANMKPRRDRLTEIAADYQTIFGVPYNVESGNGFYAYYRNIAERMKARDRKGFDPATGIDILLVVNMFLTGFDAKTCGAIYVDRNLRYHNLIQAFSRTNRILNAEKSQGNVVCFRDLRDNVDEAVALFADKNAKDQILIGSYEEHLESYAEAVDALLALTPDADSVDHLMGEEAQAAFAKAFREVARIQNVLVTFNEFEEDDISETGMDPQTFAEFRSKYLDLAEDGRKSADGDDPGPLGEMDFEIELITRVEINVDYIIGLLTKLNVSMQKSGFDSPEATDLRKRIFETLSSEPQFRTKKDIIQDFMDSKLPNLAVNADVPAAFAAYWERRRSDAFSELITEEDLHEEGLDGLIRNIKFTGKRPIDDEIVRIMKTQPGILQRRTASERIRNRIDEILDAFDDDHGAD